MMIAPGVESSLFLEELLEDYRKQIINPGYPISSVLNIIIKDKLRLKIEELEDYEKLYSTIETYNLTEDYNNTIEGVSAIFKSHYGIEFDDESTAKNLLNLHSLDTVFVSNFPEMLAHFIIGYQTNVNMVLYDSKGNHSPYNLAFDLKCVMGDENLFTFEYFLETALKDSSISQLTTLLDLSYTGDIVTDEEIFRIRMKSNIADNSIIDRTVSILDGVLSKKS